MGTIAVVACCDTKFHEIKYVQGQIAALGHTPLVVDISIGPNLPMVGDITRENILRDGGYSPEEVVLRMSKSDAIAAMSSSVQGTIRRLFHEKKIHGVLGMGGLQNTVMCSAAFRLLPLGFPKLIVSTIASGYR